MTADEIRDALRRRYPATAGPGILGAWTTLTEWQNIDLVAISAWQTPQPKSGCAYPIVGHEIKVSRGDYRRELRAPHKRRHGMAFCTSFYFAVPDGLLKPAEIEWKQPDWVLDHAAWQRTPCPDSYAGRGRVVAWGTYPSPCERGRVQVLAEGPLRQHQGRRDTVEEKCPTCSGKGYVERSRVEREAPTLWVPDDVGLIVVADGRATVAKKAPVAPSNPHRHFLLGLSDAGDSPGRRRHQIAEFARWVSARPDPRHRSLDAPPAGTV